MEGPFQKLVQSGFKQFKKQQRDCMHAYIKSENGRLTGISKDDIISINFILHIYFRIIVLPPDI